MIVVVTGRVADETGAAVQGFTVEALGDWLLTTRRLGTAQTDDEGRFTLRVSSVIDSTAVPSSFRVRVIDVVRRPVSKDRELSGAVASHEIEIAVQRGDLRGLLVTNLTGQPIYVSEGNALKLLVDGEEAFGRIADDISGARQSIGITQLFFTVPREFQPSADREKPSLVFKFLNGLVPIDPLVVNEADKRITGDRRPERLILDGAAERGLTARILLNEPVLGWPEATFWLIVAASLAVGLGAGLVALGFPAFIIFLGLGAAGMYARARIPNELRNRTHVDEVTAYFAAAIAAAAPPKPNIIVRGFRQAIPDHGVQHCKMVIVDEKRAVVVGSPFEQGYFDGPAHRIDHPHRGCHQGAVQHDVSIAVVGPAVRDLHESLRLFWNEDLDIDSTERIKEIKVPEKEAVGEDGVPPATVQVIRTLSGTRFKNLDKRSEKGILESYLRAFAAARHYIYLETQYFTDSVITDGLVAALQANRDLELILVVPINPDVMFYPRRQAYRIKQLRDADPQGDRVGVFTRWTYDGNRPNNLRPWVAPVYIHAKCAVVDDSWATVGSANLDGLSLDYNLLLSPLVFGETTAAELNVSVVPPAAGAVTPFARLMRQRLFADHLGMYPNSHELGHDRDYKWLKNLWKPKAEHALRHLKAASRDPLYGFVLEYPKENGGCLDTPRRHLAALDVDVESLVRPIRATRRFDFSTGKWSKTPELVDIEVTVDLGVRI